MLFFQRLPISPLRPSKKLKPSPDASAATNTPAASSTAATTSTTTSPDLDSISTSNSQSSSADPSVAIPSSSGNWVLTTFFTRQARGVPLIDHEHQHQNIKEGEPDLDKDKDDKDEEDDEDAELNDTDPKSWEDIERLTERDNRRVKRSWRDLKNKRAYRKFAGEAFIALLIAMLGLGCGGVVLDSVQNWSVFVQVTELFILVPVILNLKGNLELNLATRLSTASNTGTLSMRLVLGNVALMQVQAILASVAAGLWVYVLGGLNRGGKFESAKETSLVVSVSVISSSIASLFSTLLMSVIVFSCRSIGVDPDNFGTKHIICSLHFF